MKWSRLVAAAIATASAESVLQQPQLALNGQNRLVEQEQFLVELSPGEARWITEDEKWELKRVSKQPLVVRNVRLILV